MGVCKVENLVLEKITSSILSSSERMPDKWMALIFIALLPVVMNLFYKKVNSSYYNIDEKYFNFLSIKKLLVYVCVFIFIILNFAYLFYAFIINFNLVGAIIYLCLLSLLCIAAAICIYKIDINFNLNLKIKIIFEWLKDNKIINLIPKSIVLIVMIIVLVIMIIVLCKCFSVKYLVLFVVAICVCVLFFMIKKNEHCKCKNLKKSHYIFINSIPLIVLSLLSISLISCLIFSDKINENLNNRIAKQSETNTEINKNTKTRTEINTKTKTEINKKTKTNTEINTKTNTEINQYKDLSEENNQNDNVTVEYLNYVLKNSGDLKFNEFVTLFKDPKDLIRLDIDYESIVEKSQLQQNLDEFFNKIKDAHIEKELFASMRLLIILNLLLEPIIFIFAMASIFILTAALLLLLRNRFFNPKKIKIYEYIDKPGLMKEVVITEYKDKLLVMEGLIYNNSLYLDRTNYRIIDLSDKLKLAQEKFSSIILDMLDFFIPVIIIDYCSKESKHSVDISLNLHKETLKINTLDYEALGIEISCDVSFKNNCMIIKSEIKHILETIYGINNFKFKLDESAKKNFSINENTGEITINLDLK